MYKKLAEILQINIKDHELFKVACTHKSYFNESNHSAKHNERLEFLGDAVLELIATDYLFNHYPKRPEGELTALRSAIVKGKNLAQVAKRLGLGEFLLLSTGEERSGGRKKEYILANTVEAIIGAVYLDQGYEVTRVVVERELLQDVDGIIMRKEHLDSKTSLQEYTQEHFGVTPNYKLISESGPDHNKKFIMGATLSDRVIAEGQGPSKQAAEKKAAQAALNLLLSSEDKGIKEES